MKLSQRISGLLGDGSDGWEVFIKAREMIKGGIDVVELTIGEHDIRTAAPILTGYAQGCYGWAYWLCFSPWHRCIAPDCGQTCPRAYWRPYRS